MEYTKERLAHIIEKHGKWLDGEEGGERADLRGANLRGANLRFASLSGADLRSADLRFANLIGANLIGANLSRANLRGANLRFASLSGADLRSADLRFANLSGANLSGANLIGANLRRADLSRANLGGASLSGADLRSADLREPCSMNGASGNGREIKAIQADLWPVTYTATHMQIGCQLHTIEEWRAFSDDQIAHMDGEALRWWGVWKPILMNIIDVSPATPYAIKDEEE